MIFVVPFYILEKPSPFILIFLQDPLEGMEGAFLRSLLDIDCLNFLDQEKSLSEYDHTILGPVLSLEESLELIKTSGLDPHLLTFLSQESSKPSTDKDCRLLDSLENTSCIEPDAELQQEIVLQQDKEPEHEMPSQLEEMSQPQENLDCSSEVSKQMNVNEQNNIKLWMTGFCMTFISLNRRAQ